MNKNVKLCAYHKNPHENDRIPTVFPLFIISFKFTLKKKNFFYFFG